MQGDGGGRAVAAARIRLDFGWMEAAGLTTDGPRSMTDRRFGEITWTQRWTDSSLKSLAHSMMER